MFPSRDRRGWEDDIPRAYPYLRCINGIDSIGLRILMDEDPPAVREALEEDLRVFEEHNAQRLRALAEQGEDPQSLAHVEEVMDNEYELRRRENEQHLDLVRREVNTRSVVYRLRKGERSVRRWLARPSSRTGRHSDN